MQVAAGWERSESVYVHSVIMHVWLLQKVSAATIYSLQVHFEI